MELCSDDRGRRQRKMRARVPRSWWYARKHALLHREVSPKGSRAREETPTRKPPFFRIYKSLYSYNVINPIVERLILIADTLNKVLRARSQKQIFKIRVNSLEVSKPFKGSVFAESD